MTVEEKDRAGSFSALSSTWCVPGRSQDAASILLEKRERETSLNLLQESNGRISVHELLHEHFSSLGILQVRQSGPA